MTDDVAVFFLKNPQCISEVTEAPWRASAHSLGSTSLSLLSPHWILSITLTGVYYGLHSTDADTEMWVFKWLVQVWQLVMKGPAVKLQPDGLPGLPPTVVQAEYCTTLEVPQAMVWGALNYEANGWWWIWHKPPALTAPALSSLLL